ncbi:MAG: hypothetical protein U0R52_14075 [Solirubrobacterales bacterium]
MNKQLRRLVPVAAALAISAGLVACGGSDDGTDTTATQAGGKNLMLTGKDTSLVLDAATAKVLTDNKVKVSPISPAKAKGNGIAFPITGGDVNSETLAGVIDHSGGLDFSSGGTQVKLTDFVIDTTKGVLTATAGGAQLPTLDLDLSGLKESEQGGAIVASNIKATLTAQAAKALNDAFGVSLFQKGLAIGTATVTATG